MDDPFPASTRLDIFARVLGRRGLLAALLTLGGFLSLAPVWAGAARSFLRRAGEGKTLPQASAVLLRPLPEEETQAKRHVPL